MPQITKQTLVIAIKAVAWEVRSMRETIANRSAGEDDYQVLQDWLRAAEDLERPYEAQAATMINLPSCHPLVSG